MKKNFFNKIPKTNGTFLTKVKVLQNKIFFFNKNPGMRISLGEKKADL